MNNEQKKVGKLDSFFGISKIGSSFRIEVIAGLVTFLSMCYILTVNPNQFFYNGTENPMWASVFMATALGAVIGTLLMAFLAKLPLAQASGMGLNSLVGSIIGGGLGFFAYAFQFTLANAMFMVLISGLIFFILSVIKIGGVSLRQKIFEGIPGGIRTAIPVGIGLFIAYIGFQNSQVIVANQYTQVSFVDFTNWESGAAQSAVVCLVGLFAIAILSHFKVKGSVIFGILLATLVGIPLGVTNLKVITGTEPGVTWKFWENFRDFFSFGDNSVLGIAFKSGWDMPDGSIFTVAMLVISMCMIDMFDTMGTCVGCCAEAGLLDEKGVPVNYDKIMYADSIATCTGALLGTSTVTTFVESGSGIAAGGKTGLTALTTAILFFLSLFLLPVFATIPSAAAASALVYVGVLMMKQVKNVDFSDVKVSVAAFLTIIVMPLGYSITKGIGVGILSYVVITLLTYLVDVIRYAITKKNKPVWDLSIVTIIVAILFAVYFFVPTVL